MAMNSFKKMIMMANQALKKQNRVFWNQMIKINRVNTINGIIIERINDCTFKINGTLTKGVNTNAEGFALLGYNFIKYPFSGLNTIIFKLEHISGYASPDNIHLGNGYFDSKKISGNYLVAPLSSTKETWISTNLFLQTKDDVVTFEDYTFSVLCYDLTLMFGAGNEPATVEEFEQRIKGIPVDIYAYNKGEWVEWDTKINPNDYLTFEALNDGVKLLYKRGTSTFQYSADLGKSWQNWLPESYSPILNVGDKLLVKCVNPVINSTYGIGTITSDQGKGYNYKVSGDIMSMLYGDDASIHYSLKGYDRCFSNFLLSQRLLDAGDLVLKARELAPYCYNQLLYGCNNNTRLPRELPAKNLASNCYRYFSNGGTYTEMPIVKAQLTADYSLYSFITASRYVTKADLSIIKQISGTQPLREAFKGCSALNYIKIGWKQWASPSELSSSWVEGVASQGVFVIPIDAEFDPESIRGNNGIPAGWEVKYYDPDNIDDVRDNKEDFYPQERGR